MEEAEISELLAAASRLVDAAKLPDDLRATAFAKTVDLLTGREAAAKQPAAAARVPAAADHGRTEKPIAGKVGSLDAAAQTLKLDRAILDAVVAVEDGQPVIHVSPAFFQSKARPAMRQFLLTLTAVRQGGGWEDLTDGAVIRKQMNANYKSLYDEKNFANAVADLKDSMRNTRGKLKVIPAGYPAAATLITALAGGGEKKPGEKKSDS